MMMTPTAPSEFGTSVDDLAAAYSPQELQKRYKVTKELVYLLALQKVKSEMDAAQRSIAMSQQQVPGTVKQQLENQVMQGKMQEASGIMSQMPQMPQMPQMAQRQPQMAAQGGIVGYQNGGGAEEGAQDVSFGDLAAEFGSGVVGWVKNNPTEAALLGISILPGVGPAAAGALRVGRMGFNYLRANPTAQKLATAAKDVAVKSITKPRKIERVGQDQPMGQAAQSLGYPTTRGTTPSGIAGKQYDPVKGVAISSGIAGISSALKDDEEDEAENIVNNVVTTPDVSDDQTASEKAQARINELIGRPVDTSGFTSTEEESVGSGEGANNQDVMTRAKDAAPKVQDLAPELFKSIDAEAGMTSDQIGKNRQAEIDRYLKSIDATKRKTDLEAGFQEQTDTLENLLDPEARERRRRLAFFSNIGTGGIGSILRGGTRALLEEEAAQDELIRDAAKIKTDNLKTLSDFDLGMVQAAEDKGLAILELDRADRRVARASLASASEANLRSINEYANRMQRSEDNTIKNELTKLRLLADNYNQMRADDRADKATATKGLIDIISSIITITQNEEAKYTDISRLELERDLGTISKEDAQKLVQLKTYVANAVNALLEKEGLQDIRESFADTIKAITERQTRQLTPQDLLGLM